MRRSEACNEGSARAPMIDVWKAKHGGGGPEARTALVDLAIKPARPPAISSAEVTQAAELAVSNQA